MQKNKSQKISRALVSFCEEHQEIFVIEEKTKSFLPIAEKILGKGSDEEELVSFISDEEAGLWKLVSEKRSRDFLHNPAGFLMVNRKTTKCLPQGCPETIEEAVSKYLKFSGEGRLEEALKNFYAWEILLLEKNGLDASILASDERIFEFTSLLASIPKISRSVKRFRFPAGESNKTFKLLDALFKTYALVYENAGVYYNLKDAKEIAAILVKWRASAKEPGIMLIKENDKCAPLKKRTDKPVLEFRAAEIYSMRKVAPNKIKSGDWSAAPSYWTIKARKALESAFAELEKEKLEFIAASADCYAGTLAQGCGPDLRVYVRGEESSISQMEITNLINKNAFSRGIALNLSRLEIEYLAKETDKVRFSFSPKDTGVFVIWPGKHQLLPRTGGIEDGLIIRFDGKTMSSIELLRNELLTVLNGLKCALELSADNRQKKEHYHTALNSMEELLRENEETFKELITETCRNQKFAGEEEIYVQTISKLTGVERRILDGILKQNRKTNPHILPDYKGGIWHDHISSLRKKSSHARY
jgi:hypothetical protein